MIVVLREEFDVLEAVADLGDATLLVSDYSLIEDYPVDEDGLVKIFEDLQLKICVVLARMGQVVEVTFYMDEDPSSDLGMAMERALENTPSSVVITPELVEQVQLEAAEEARQTKWIFERLEKVVKEEGLKRGLNKEERQKITLGEALRLDEGESSRES